MLTARPADPRADERAALETVEGAGGRHSAVWVALDDVRRGATPLYPAGLLDLVEAAH